LFYHRLLIDFYQLSFYCKEIYFGLILYDTKKYLLAFYNTKRIISSLKQKYRMKNVKKLTEILKKKVRER